MFRVRRLTDAIGVMLALVALFLILEKSDGFTRIVTALAGGGGDILRILQGRDRG